MGLKESNKNKGKALSKGVRTSNFFLSASGIGPLAPETSPLTTEWRASTIHSEPKGWAGLLDPTEHDRYTPGDIPVLALKNLFFAASLNRFDSGLDVELCPFFHLLPLFFPVRGMDFIFPLLPIVSKL